jgi:hypothetical protein
MENYYYECIYDVLRHTGTNGANLPTLNRLKAKIVILHSNKLKTILIDEEADRLGGEQPTIYNILRMQHRSADRTIRSIKDEQGRIMTSPSDIAHTFTSFLRNKYDTLEVGDECVNTMNEAARPDQPTTYGEILENPIDTAEIYNAIRSGGRNRALGNDGLGLKFYAVNWTIIREDLCNILNQMFTAGTITPK